MSEETYYIILNVSETASAVEIKTAYWGLIKQVHPDTITNLAPYLRKIAEDKAKEITEAYGVLSNSSKRRDYDDQLAAYRRQSAPHAPPTPQAPPTPPQQPSQCPICGRSDGGHSAACVNSRTTQATSATTPKPATPKVVRRFGYNWGPLLDWSGEHPITVVLLFIAAVFGFAALFSDTNAPQSSASTPQASASTPQSFTNNAAATSPGPYSKYPCDFRDKVSPIDGKPCSESRDQSVPATAGFTVVSEEPAPSEPTISVEGIYSGTVHNQTGNLSSTFTVALHQTKAGLLDGCVEVKPPLYGSGALTGSVRGSHVNFVVADITFQGDTSKNAIAGSYVVTRQGGNQLGDFRLTKQPGMEESYGCASDGTLVEVEVQPAPKPRPKPEALYAIVGQYYGSIYKRCAFLPQDNYGRCNYKPETVAKLKTGDRVRVLSRMVRAENGDDIYKVRTEQGWEGWIDARGITLESQ